MKRPAELRTALLWRARATRRLWGREPDASSLLANAVPTEPHGHIDPLPPRARPGSVAVKGWVLFPDAATDRVEIFAGERPLGRARLGVARVDVARHWKSTYAPISGFELNADLSDWEGEGKVRFRVLATSVDGERYELTSPPVAISVADSDEAKLPPPAPVAPTLAGPRPRVLVFTHQLGLGGAQLYLLDLLGQMVKDGHASFVVVSALDGPVRESLEELGIPVHISGPAPFDELASHLGRVEEMAGWAQGRGFDAVLVNTATTMTFVGAEVAERLDLPVVWAIHESFPPSFLWAELAPQVRERLDRALQRASCLLFEAEATLRLFEPTAGEAQCVMLPYGLDLEPIDAARASFDRTAVRRRLGVPEDARAIVCVGTVEPRKAQALLAQAFDRIAARHPKAHLYFIGGREDDDSEALQQYISAPETSDRMTLVPLSKDVQPWYGLADLLVCASDVESLPRTVLEAMAWETPVLATNVFGLPELIEHGETGWLCEARDLEALADALAEVLDTPADSCERIAHRARVLVEQRHSLPHYAERVSDLLRGATEASIEPQRRIASR
jgi:D-inositol-3-phosphate glycosyltransferase